MTSRSPDCGPIGISKATTRHQHIQLPAGTMFNNYMEGEPRMADCLGFRPETFEYWMSNHKFIWDRELGGGAIPIEKSSIQHGDFITLPIETSIQHGQAEIPTTPESSPEASPILSARLAFCCQLSRTPPIFSLSSSPISTTSHSSTSSQPPLFTTEYFEVRNSSKKGYGAFATKDIAVDTVILTEKPLLQSSEGGFYAVYDALSQAKREEFKSLYCNKGLAHIREMATYLTNRFQTVNSATTGIFTLGSRFNHACRPYRTCSYTYSKDDDTLTFTAVQPMKMGQEITISYTDNPSMLLDHYGFACDCPACPDPETAKMNDAMNRGSIEGDGDEDEDEDELRGSREQRAWRSVMDNQYQPGSPGSDGSSDGWW